MKIDLVDLFENGNTSIVVPGDNDEFVRVLLENGVEQGFRIVPFVEDGKKQYRMLKEQGNGSVVDFNPILEGDWVEGFPRL